jgi:hypothetical protein
VVRVGEMWLRWPWVQPLFRSRFSDQFLNSYPVYISIVGINPVDIASIAPLTWAATSRWSTTGPAGSGSAGAAAWRTVPCSWPHWSPSPVPSRGWTTGRGGRRGGPREVLDVGESGTRLRDALVRLTARLLLCGRHHRVIHHTPWDLRLSSTDRRPEFKPPPKLGLPGAGSGIDPAGRRPCRRHGVRCGTVVRYVRHPSPSTSRRVRCPFRCV